MRRIIALTVAAVMVSAMICGCAKQTKQPNQVTVTTTEAATDKKIVINDEKPSETVERVPEEVKATEETKAAAQTDTTAAPAASADGTKAPNTSVETGAAPKASAETADAPNTQQAASNPAPQTGTEKASKTAEGDMVSNDYSPYAGKYIRTEDGSTFELGKDGKVKISIVRLTEMEGKADGIYKNIIKMTVKDANDGDMKLEFLTESNELVVTGSTWSLLPNGETFKFNKKE